jgi:hypothetical protein
MYVLRMHTAGFLIQPSAAVVQASLDTLLSNATFFVFAYFRPLTHQSPTRMLLDNVNSVLKLGLGALSLILLTVGPLLSDTDDTGDGGSSGGSSGSGSGSGSGGSFNTSADSRQRLLLLDSNITAALGTGNVTSMFSAAGLPQNWVNKAVTAASMLALVMSMALLVWDLANTTVVPLYAATTAKEGDDHKVSDENKDEGKAAADEEKRAPKLDQPIGRAQLTRSKLKRVIV